MKGARAAAPYSDALAWMRSARVGHARDFSGDFVLGLAAGNVVPSSADPFATKVGLVLSMAGANPTPEGIRALKTFVKTLGIEALAMFGPMLWLALLDGLRLVAANRSTPSTRSEHVEPKRVKADTSGHAKTHNPGPLPEKSDPVCTAEFERFCADELEEGGTYSIKAGPAYKSYTAWCHRHGPTSASQKRFGLMMGHKFTHDKNHGYPAIVGFETSPRVQASASCRVIHNPTPVGSTRSSPQGNPSRLGDASESRG